MNKNIIDINTGQYARKSYLAYAMHVTKGRAIPFIQDGLKPVHRRIIYGMIKLGLVAEYKHVKSARVVGEVLGKYHPHGDSSVYDAMVILSQDFATRYPLIDGQGNWGSLDGDSAAAMRYTEAKLTKFAKVLTEELSYNTVDFRPNYDGSEQEPTLLPSRLPLLLLNGSSGIAVAIRTECPSHNIEEVVEATKYVLNTNPKKQNMDDLMQIIKGPDFPNGGQIINSQKEIIQAYKDGKGKVTVRAKWKVIQEGKNWYISFYELPPAVSVSKIIEQVNGIITPDLSIKDKKSNKKNIQSKLTLKKILLEQIDNIKDLSDNNEISLAVYPTNKGKKQNPEEIAEFLFQYTELQKNVSFDFTAVDLEGNPKNKNILEWLNEWCLFRIETVRRKFNFLLEKTQKRLHILNGRIIVINNIDKVIKIIKDSDDPKQELMKKFKLDEIQTDDILELRLRAISNLETKNVLNEIEKLNKLEKEYTQLLSDEKNIKKEIISNLNQDLKEFNDPRRTSIEEIKIKEKIDFVSNIIQDKINDDPIAVAFTKKGWLCWKTAKQIESVNVDDFKLKNGDKIINTYLAKTSNSLLFMDDYGKGYSLNLDQLLEKNSTEPVIKWLDTINRINICQIYTGNEKFLVFGEKGYGFLLNGNNWISKLKAGKNILTLDDGEKAKTPILLSEDKKLVCVLSKEKRFCCYNLEEIKELSKGKGVMLMKLNDSDLIENIQIIGPEDDYVYSDIKIKNKDLQKYLSKRGNKGKLLK